MRKGRLPKACILCRRTKAKCHISEGKISCDKCTSLQVECSFSPTYVDTNPDPLAAATKTARGRPKRTSTGAARVAKQPRQSLSGIEDASALVNGRYPPAPVSSPGGLAENGGPPAALTSRLSNVEAQLESIMRVVTEQRVKLDRYEGVPPGVNGSSVNSDDGYGTSPSHGPSPGTPYERRSTLTHHPAVGAYVPGPPPAPTLAYPLYGTAPGVVGHLPNVPAQLHAVGRPGNHLGHMVHHAVHHPAYSAAHVSGLHQRTSSASPGSSAASPRPPLSGRSPDGVLPSPVHSASGGGQSDRGSGPALDDGVGRSGSEGHEPTNVSATIAPAMLSSSMPYESKRPRPEADPRTIANPAARANVGSIGFPYQSSLAYFVSSVVSPVYRYGQHFVGPARDPVPDDDIISKGLLTREQVVELLGYFRDNYNHWVLFDQALSDEELTDWMLSRSHLLVLTCCCIALRSGRPHLRAKAFPVLVQHLASELHAGAAHVPQTIDFLRSVALIGTFGDSLSSQEILFDIWAVTCMGIEHFRSLVVGDDDSILLSRLWNHLTLAHLTACNTSGRQSLVDAHSISFTRTISGYSQASHFDLCIVAEISLHHLSYRYATYALSHDELHRELEQWHNDWNFLLAQPAIQFVGAVSHYLEFNIHLQESVRSVGFSPSEFYDPLRLNGPEYYTTSSTYLDAIFRHHASGSLVSMLTHLSKTIQALMEIVPQEFFAFLSDGLHRMGFVSSVMALRLGTLLSKRPDSSETSLAVQSVVHQVRQLADRFRLTSGSPGDMSNSFALSIYDLFSRFNL